MLGRRKAREGQREFGPKVITEREMPNWRCCEGGGGWQSHRGQFGGRGLELGKPGIARVDDETWSMEGTTE